MFEGRLLAIATTSSATLPMQPADEIEAITGQGLRGDRYAQKSGTFTRGEIEPSQQVTLIESEAIEAAVRDAKLDITHLDTRRNLLTEGVPLNHLVGKTFTVGSVTLRGVKLCEPCGHLEKLTCAGIEKTLLHRGGLRAEVVQGGTLRVGDTIRAVGE
jgi:MOSC domain-containing protein YiiM